MVSARTTLIRFGGQAHDKTRHNDIQLLDLADA
jgi:hypothetical protein